MSSAFLRIGRLRSAVTAMLSIAVAAFLAVVPTPGFELHARSGSAFSAWTSDQCLAAPERHIDARRAVPRSKVARSTALPDPLDNAAEIARFNRPATAGVTAFPALANLRPRDHPSTRHARAPPSA